MIIEMIIERYQPRGKIAPGLIDDKPIQ